MNVTSQINALISLLEDQDEFIVESARHELVQKDCSIIPMLSHAQTIMKDSRLRKLLADTIDEIEMNELKREIVQWKYTEAKELEELAYIIGKITYRKLDRIEHRDMFQKEVCSFAKRINPSLTSLEKISVFNEYFYRKQKYLLNTSNSNLPQNYYPHKVLQNHKATPASLTFLYALFAQKVDIPLIPLDIKGFFLLGYREEEHGHKIIHNFPYRLLVNPLNSGSIISKKEFEFFIDSHTVNLPLSEIPAGNNVLAKRLLVGLQDAYVKLGDNDEAERIRQIYDEYRGA